LLMTRTSHFNWIESCGVMNTHLNLNPVARQHLERPLLDPLELLLALARSLSLPHAVQAAVSLAGFVG